MPKANLRKLPVWYYRLVQITIEEDRDIEASDFDEDISELDVCDTCSEEEKSCECGGDKQDAHEEDTRDAGDEDEGDSSDEDTEDSDEDDEDSDVEDSYDSEDAVSERSYDGSDAEYYYELKEDREQRKRDLLKIRECAQKEKVEAYSFERSKEEEVQSAYDAMKLKKKRSTSLRDVDSIASNKFTLYSTDWVEHCYHSCASKFVRLNNLRDIYDSDHDLIPSSSNGLPRYIQGDLQIGEHPSIDITPFRPPRNAGLDEIKLKCMDRRFEFTIQFISHNYLKLKVGREFLFQKGRAPPQAPEYFEFVGIRHDEEKERAEKAQKRKQSPSPRETWFEMNHPMGWWAQSRW